LPDHSSLTRIRERYGLLVFGRFFERIVEECIEVGLVWGDRKSVGVGADSGCKTSRRFTDLSSTPFIP
jgi:hypothetical protein